MVMVAAVMTKVGLILLALLGKGGIEMVGGQNVLVHSGFVVTKCIVTTPKV